MPSDNAFGYPAGVTMHDHIAHDIRVGRFPKRSSVDVFLAERRERVSAKAWDGYPYNRETDGDHLIVERIGGQRMTRAWWWDGEVFSRVATDRMRIVLCFPADMAKRAEEYLGPVTLPAEVGMLLKAIAELQRIRATYVLEGGLEDTARNMMGVLARLDKQAGKASDRG